MKHRIMAMILPGILLCKICLADNSVTQVSRYLTVTNKPQFSQTHLLSQSIQVRFTRNTQTVGDAINYLLRFSGYSLIEESQRSSALKIMLSKPLPVIDHELGPVSLSHALTTLSGKRYNFRQIKRILYIILSQSYSNHYPKFY